MKGLGESAPLHGFSPETVEQAAQELARISRSLLGRNPTRDWLSAEGDFSRELGATGLSPSARFGFELAIHNLYAASEGKTLFESLYPSTVASVPVNGLLSGSLDEVLEEARWMRDAGYETVKLKVGRRGVQEDAKSVRALREVLGENVALRIDANRAWSLEEAATFVRAVGAVRYEYIEEPLADPSRLAGFVGEHGVPVALDESLVGMPPEELECHNYARAVVLKPTIIGGISRTLRLAEEALRGGIVPVVSSAYEAGIGTEGLLALSAATGGGNVAAGLDTYRQLGVDVLDPALDLTSPRVDLLRESNVKRELRRDLLHILDSSEV